MPDSIENIVQKMVDAGESDEDIGAVISEYKSLHGGGVSGAPHVGALSEKPSELGGLNPGGSSASLTVPAMAGAAIAGTARPALKYVAGKAAEGYGGALLKTAARVAGGAAGMSVGTALGSPYAGSIAGYQLSGSLGRKLAQGVKTAGQVAETALDTAKPLPVRGPGGRMMKGPLPFGRATVDALDGIVPGIANVGILSSLLEQQGDGAGLQTPESAARARLISELGRSEQGLPPMANTQTGQLATDIQLPSATSQAIPQDVRDELFRLMLQRGK